jgi:nucleoid DNA-binding protein
MNKSKLIDAVAAKLNTTKKQADEVYHIRITLKR